MYRVSRHFASAAVIGLCMIPATAARAEDEDRNDFVQTNLVSDIPGLATITDRELLNPWGVSHTPMSPFWVSNQATSTSTLYSVTDETKVSKVNLTVAIPKTAQGPKDRLAKSTMSTLRRSRWEMVETVVPRTSSLPI